MMEFASVRDSIEQLCAAKGLKMTGQRRVIARVLSEAEDHPDVELVHKRAAEIDTNIYEEASDEHHDHLIDIESGKVIEFHSEEIEKIQEEVAKKLGYRLVDHRLALYGAPLKKKKKK
jgi:Fur family ferric uptake transcriptional regulator